MPLANVKTSSGRHMMRLWHHITSNDDGNEDQNAKTKSHGGGRRVAEGRLTPKGTVKQCHFKRKSTWVTKLCERLQTGHDLIYSLSL